YLLLLLLFFFTAPAPPPFYTLSLHDALPISFVLVAAVQALKDGENLFVILFLKSNAVVLNGDLALFGVGILLGCARELAFDDFRSEEHTSELQSRSDLVCRLLLEKKKQYRTK